MPSLGSTLWGSLCSSGPVLASSHPSSVRAYRAPLNSSVGPMNRHHQAVDGHLSLWDLEDLEAAEATADRASVKVLHLGAHLYSALPVKSLISRLSIYDRTNLIRLADDRTPDEDMKKRSEEHTSELQSHVNLV